MGIATGHAYVQYWRAPPADFDGWAALPFSMALLAVAMAMCVRLVHRRQASSILFLAAAALVAVAMACELAPRLFGLSAPTPFTGLVAEDSLRTLLSVPWLARLADEARPAMFSWLKISCVLLIGVAIVFKLFGVTKQSARRHAVLAAPVYLVFGLPFLAWASLELIQYLFGTLPAGSAQAVDSFPARASLTLSALLVVAGMWLFVLLCTGVLVLRALGFSVQWRKEVTP